MEEQSSELTSKEATNGKPRVWFIMLSVGICALVVVGGIASLSFWRKATEKISASPLSSESNQQPLTGSSPQMPAIDVASNDTDRDGISNDEEKKLGLNPKEFDTDGDGLSDKNELRVWKTDPKNRDTDDDGSADGIEVIEGTDPLRK